MANKTAKSVAHVLLNEIIPRHSCPQVIISDRGTEFVNAVISCLTEQMRVSHIRTSPYHPQSNGKTERFHRYVNDSLAKYSHKEPHDWDKYIPSMLMAYRTITNETTEKSPFLVLYGRDPILPIDTLIQPKLKYFGDDFVPICLQRMHHVYLDAKENIRKMQEKNQRLANKNARPEEFQPGDAVHYYDISYSQNNDQSQKLQSKFKPFYRIIKRNGPVNYKIKHQITGATKNVHQKDLKRVDPSECWQKQYEKYSELTAHKQAPENNNRRIMPPRLAKVSAPLSDPETQSDLKDSEKVPPLRLARTTQGWQIQDEPMEIDSIVLFSLKITSPLI